MKIGVFGGSFNPPHKMHERIVDYLIKNKYFDNVIFVPTGNRYQKKDLIDCKHRYEMLKIMCRKNDKFLVSDYELKNELKYTYETLDYFKNIFPDNQIYFILGADNLESIKTWKRSSYLLENYYFLVVDRDNSKVKLEKIYKEYREHIEFVPIAQDIISSTIIRRYLKEKEFKSVSNELDNDVLKYIIKNNLYK